MSVLSSMATAISGLESNGQNLAVISDNIVNANTMGYKSSRGEFHSILAQDLLSATGGQLGRGVTMAGITGIFSQGAITKTERGTDVAVNGNGFFVLRGENKGMTFTRDGSFSFDKEGWLTTLTGERVQAYLSDVDGKITGKLGDIRIPYKTINAKSTSRLELNFNLDARMPLGAAFDVTKPEQTSQFTSGFQVFDSIGASHAVNIYFNKTADKTWSWTAMVDGADLEGGIVGTPDVMAEGNLIFDEQGKLLTSEQTLVNTTFANGAIPDQQIAFDFGDAIDAAGTGAKGTTQYGSKNAMFRNVQDGYSAGMLTNTGIDSDGVITGVYSNGVNKVLGQLSLARFEATERLAKLGENQFRESIQSGTPIIGKANTNGLGALINRSLENSNVDLAKEFVEMIKSQRGFQASAKSITTANEMLDEIINIKRV